MNDSERMSTEQLWSAIESNAERAQHETNWVDLLDNIKVLCALIDERIGRFQRRMRTEQLIRRHRRLGDSQVSR